MRLKILIKAPNGEGVREVEISTYDKAGQQRSKFFTMPAPYEEQYLVRGYYLSGFLDGCLSALDFSSELEKQGINDLMRLHVGQSIVLEYEQQHCSVNII